MASKSINTWYKSEPSKITKECEEIQQKYMECLINNKYNLSKCDHVIETTKLYPQYVEQNSIIENKNK